MLIKERGGWRGGCVFCVCVVYDVVMFQTEGGVGCVTLFFLLPPESGIEAV